jgi:caffeoyl-CoA O-methyltransferase
MSDGPKSFFLSREVHQYLLEHGTQPDSLLRELAEETNAKLGALAGMQVAPEQGAFMTMLTRLIGARRAIEVGTFTGYSALCIARGLSAEGQLICCDVSEEWTSIGRRYWEKAGVSRRIDLRIGPAQDTLRELPPDSAFDLAFIDADKPNYPVYFEELVTRMRPGGVILVDNVLWGGAVANPENTDPHTEAIRAFNTRVAGDERVEAVMLPISDGLSLLRVR